MLPAHERLEAGHRARCRARPPAGRTGAARGAAGARQRSVSICSRAAASECMDSSKISERPRPAALRAVQRGRPRRAAGPPAFRVGGGGHGDADGGGGEQLVARARGRARAARGGPAPRRAGAWPTSATSSSRMANSSPSEPRHRVARAQAGLEPARQRHQHLVAHAVPEAVVDHLELVQVQAADGERSPRPPAVPRQGQPQRGPGTACGWRGRSGVVQGVVDELLLRLLAPRHVGLRPGHPRRRGPTRRAPPGRG